MTKKKLTKADHERIDALLVQMKASADRTRELAERAQAKLDTERSGGE